MDLNRLFSRIKKYLGKNSEFSMREFNQLQLLKEDVLKLEKIMGYSGENQTALLEHYKGHAQKLQRYSEKIERRLNVWIKRLERLIIAEEQSLTARDRRYFELFKNKIDVCKNNLVRILAKGGELHNLVNERYPDWKKVEAKINEALGDNQHSGLRTLIVLLQNLKHVKEKLGLGGNLINIDVLVHPYHTEAEGISSRFTEEKTRRWRNAIGELGHDDYLIIVRHPNAARVGKLTDELIDYTRNEVGCKVVVYVICPGDDVKKKVGSPEPSSIKRVRGYGEFGVICVERWTGDVRAKLGLYGDDIKKVIFPGELSIQDYEPFGFYTD